MTPDLLKALCDYSWPGNVRELRNVMERMVVLGHGDKLTLRDVPPHLLEGADAFGSGKTSISGGSSMRETERQLIQDALQRHRGSRTAAAAELGISRRTLHRKLNEFGLRDKINKEG
jgi:DNA-binding NtrC family response regulator